LTLAATKPVFASALSETRQTLAAIDEVITDLAGRIPGAPDLMAVFATPHHTDQIELIHRRLRDAFQPRHLLGATAEGVIGVQREVERTAGLSVMLGHLPGSRLLPLRYDPQTPDKLACTISARDADDDANLDTDNQAKAVILLADPFSTPLTALIPAIAEAFGGAPIIGGVASGAGRPDGNRLLGADDIHHDGAVGIAIAGDVHTQCTVSQGCRPIGRPYVITRAQRNVVLELGGRNALELLQDMVQELDVEERELIQSHGLLVGRVINEYKRHFGRGDFLIRGLSGIDETSGAIGIADPAVRVGQTIQFHVRDRATAREDLALLLEAQKLHGEGAGALLFSCNGRGTRLFNEPHNDAAQVAAALGEVPLAGFFAAGEIGPVGHENFLHGHTASLLVFRGHDPATTAEQNPS